MPRRVIGFGLFITRSRVMFFRRWIRVFLMRLPLSSRSKMNCSQTLTQTRSPHTRSYSLSDTLERDTQTPTYITETLSSKPNKKTQNKACKRQCNKLFIDFCNSNVGNEKRKENCEPEHGMSIRCV